MYSQAKWQITKLKGKNEYMYMHSRAKYNFFFAENIFIKFLNIFVQYISENILRKKTKKKKTKKKKKKKKLIFKHGNDYQIR